MRPMRRLLCAAAVLGLFVGVARSVLASELVIEVTRDGKSSFSGDDDAPIRRAIEQLAGRGGTILIQPGRYSIRMPLIVHSGITLRGIVDGENDTVLALPTPAVTMALASKGATTLQVGDSSSFVAQTSVELLPPFGSEAFGKDGTVTSIKVMLKAVTPGRLEFDVPLAHSFPAGSRVGYSHNIVVVRDSSGGVTIDRLRFDGGWLEKIPMPGHHLRSAVWASSHYAYDKGPLLPPINRLVVKNCTFRNLYGRGVALYNVVDSAVFDNTLMDIGDEAIDLDHFTYRTRVAGNRITRATTGVTLNDASYCIVEDNIISHCAAGIVMWWWHMCPQEGLNERNTIQRNRVMNMRKTIGISLGQRCHHNIVRDNIVADKVSVVEASNNVENNRKPDEL